MRWTGLSMRMGETTGAYAVLVGKLKGSGHFGVLRVDRRIILKLIIKKWYGRSGFIRLRTGESGGLL